MTRPDADWTGLTARTRGFVVGFCIGDALGSPSEENEGPRVVSRLSRVFLNEAMALEWAILGGVDLLDRRAEDAPRNRRAERGLAVADLVLARSLPMALALTTRYPRTLPNLSLVNGGWLNLLVDRRNGPKADAPEVAVARVLVRNAARRLNGEPVHGLDTPEALTQLQPELGYGPGLVGTQVARLNDESRRGERLDISSYGAPGEPVRTAAGALALLAALESQESAEHVRLADGQQPVVAALAFALFGASHGVDALPLRALGQMAGMRPAERAAQSIVSAARAPRELHAEHVGRLGSVTLHDAERRTLRARRSAHGDLLIEGQDLTGDEYEWVHTIAPVDIETVVSALGGRTGDDVLPLLEAGGEQIWREGEGTWLKRLGVPADFWSWGDLPLY